MKGQQPVSTTLDWNKYRNYVLEGVSNQHTEVRFQMEKGEEEEEQREEWRALLLCWTPQMSIWVIITSTLMDGRRNGKKGKEKQEDTRKNERSLLLAKSV